MSALKRIASGSAAAWTRILTSVFSQVLVTPIYLSHWSREAYGVWLVMQAMISLQQVADTGHQCFWENEFLRLGNSDRGNLRLALWSAASMGFVLGGVQFVFVLIIVSQKLLPVVLGIEGSAGYGLFSDAAVVMAFYSLMWWILGSVGGLVTRVLYPLGYYPRMAWWGVVNSVGGVLIPAGAVIFGGGVLAAGCAQVIAAFLIQIPLGFDLWRLLEREGLRPTRPDWRLAVTSLLRSQLLTAKSVLEVSRQQGTRLVLASMAGANLMATFAVTRTGANMALQGLSTITNPVLPELMGFLRRRDQERSEACFAAVWLVVSGVLAPLVVVLQAFVEPAFVWWTRGRIPFDPVLFGTLSLGVLVYAAAQPAMAVAQGNNLLRAQVGISMAAALAAFGGMVILVPRIGVRGAAISLLLAECTAAVGYWRAAAEWLHASGLVWPQQAFLRVVASVAVSGLAIVGITLFSEGKGAIIATMFACQTVLFLAYWRGLPALARMRVTNLIASPLPK